MPPRSSVQTIVIGPEHAGRRLDNYLMFFLGKLPKSLIYNIIRRGEVRVNSSRARPRQRLQSGDKIRIPPLDMDNRTTPVISTRRLEQVQHAILFEDEHLMILNKPSGIAVHSGTGLKYGVVDVVRSLRAEIDGIELAHRLDRETSGCLVLAKDPPTLRDIQTLLRRGEVEKSYVALLKGGLGRDDVRITENLRSVRDGKGERRTRISADGRPAETRLASLERFSGTTLVAVELLTGRTHQIRSHAAHIGHPVAGDRRYGDPDFNKALRDFGLRRLFLHANRIRFQLPGSKSALCIEAPMPDELNKVLDSLRNV